MVIMMLNINDAGGEYNGVGDGGSDDGIKKKMFQKKKKKLLVETSVDPLACKKPCKIYGTGVKTMLPVEKKSFYF